MDSNTKAFMHKTRGSTFERFEIDPTWKILMHQGSISLACERIAHEVDSRLSGKDVVLAVILKGAAYFAVDLSRLMKTDHSLYFIEASSYKDKQTQSEQLEILSIIKPEKFSGKHVLLVDELYDNGFTLFKVKEELRRHVPTLTSDDITTCVMFAKDKVTKYPPPDISGVTIPNVWVVGYGLDDKQKKRGLMGLYAKQKDNPEMNTPDDRIFHDEEYYQKVCTTLNCNTRTF